MATEYIDPKWAEDKRRLITRNLADRGTFSQTAETASNDQQQDYAEAAYAAFQGRQGGGTPLMFEGSPVQLQANAQMAEQEAAAAQRQREIGEIFERGRYRELLAEDQRYDRMGLLAEAYNTQLNRFDASLARQAEERAAAAARASSRSGGGGGGGGSTWTPSLAPVPTDEGPAAPAGNDPSFYEDAALGLIDSAIANGANWTDVYGRLYQNMVGGGVDPADAEAWIMSWARNAYDQRAQARNTGGGPAGAFGPGRPLSGS